MDQQSQQFLTIAQWNARSLRNKREEIPIIANQANILCISETWLSPNYNLNIKVFKIYRKDRDSLNPGGGVVIAISNHIQSREL